MKVFCLVLFLLLQMGVCISNGYANKPVHGELTANLVETRAVNDRLTLITNLERLAENLDNLFILRSQAFLGSLRPTEAAWPETKQLVEIASAHRLRSDHFRSESWHPFTQAMDRFNDHLRGLDQEIRNQTLLERVQRALMPYPSTLSSETPFVRIFDVEISLLASRVSRVTDPLANDIPSVSALHKRLDRRLEQCHSDLQSWLGESDERYGVCSHLTESRKLLTQAQETLAHSQKAYATMEEWLLQTK